MAVTDHLRLKRVDSFFNVDKFTLDAIRLSFGSQEETIPLSKGINVIIGDNSIGKSMILHAITHELNDNEPDDNEVHDEATTISATSVEMDTNIIRVIPLYDLAVCAGDGDFVDETIGHEDFRTENEEADYALTISGESMEPTIPNGSIVLVKSVAELSNNDIAIVSTGSEAMCKRYIKRGRGEYLKPDNPKFKEFSKRDYKTFLIRGKVIDILKP